MKNDGPASRGSNAGDARNACGCNCWRNSTRCGPRPTTRWRCRAGFDLRDLLPSIERRMREPAEAFDAPIAALALLSILDFYSREEPAASGEEVA